MPFTQQTLDFLAENRLRDSRPWFHEHKETYRRCVVEPLTELTTRLIPVMNGIDPLLVTEPKRCMSRVYRDTRYTHDKSLYRDVMWCSFLRDKNEYYCPPGFFFEFSPRGFRYGYGYYSAPTSSMKAMRELILAGDKGYKAAKRAYASQDVFTMQGDVYKRPRYADAPPDDALWLERRNIDFIHDSTDFDLLMSDGLADVLAEGFVLLKPIHEFLSRTVARID